MHPIYVFGHKNPDTDSIISAISYAYLRNQLGDAEYQAMRLGQVNDETAKILERFQFEAPPLITSVRTQVKDLNFDTPPSIGSAASLGYAWQLLQENKEIGALTIVSEDKKLFGVLSHSDIYHYDVSNIKMPMMQELPVFNLLGVLEGHLVEGCKNHEESVSGEIIIALPHQDRQMLLFGPDKIVVCGDQPDLIRYALECGVKTLILCGAQYPEDLLKNYPEALLISTPFDAYRAARSISNAAPVGRICRRDKIVAFYLNDYLDDVREEMLKHRANAYPILDSQDQVVGMLTRYQLISPRRKRVVLVDHNEMAQSVAGLEQAEILEIIDHHRLADVQTGNPILFRNEPIGSTTSIVAGMFQERGIMPSVKLAGLMAAAILSDTVMLRSPTCTAKDRLLAESMARIGRVSLEELGNFIFSASNSQNRSAHELFYADYKEFHIAGHLVGISQITCYNSSQMLEKRVEFLDLMSEIKQKMDYEMVLLMITDVLRNGTEILYSGDDALIEQAFGASGKEEKHFFLPGVMSRKKQIVPLISLLWG